MITLNRLREMRAQKVAAAAAAQDADDTAALAAKQTYPYAVDESIESFCEAILSALKEKYAAICSSIELRPRNSKWNTSVCITMRVKDFANKSAIDLGKQVEDTIRKFIPEPLILSAEFRDMCYPEADCCCEGSPCSTSLRFSRYTEGAVTLYQATNNTEDKNDYRIEVSVTNPKLFAEVCAEAKRVNDEQKSYLDRMAEAANGENTHIELIDPESRYSGVKSVEGAFNDMNYAHVRAKVALTEQYKTYWNNKIVELQLAGEYARILAAFKGEEASKDITK